MISRIVHAVFFLVLCPALVCAGDRPNVLLIVADDLGFSDVGFNGCKEIPTPHLDALAADGVVFEAGYASHSYCSPSRAGLLTGRYQQRFGHECNPGAYGEDAVAGLPLSETLISNVLVENGYHTGAVGKWHLGDAPKFWPTERGFQDWFGFSGGGMSYWGDSKKTGSHTGVLRNGIDVAESELSYLTDDFSAESVRFIQRNQSDPFFLYLAYNAPHGPDQVTREHLKKTEHIEYGGRAVYGAMVAAMDEGIGRVVSELKKQGLYDNTLIIFFSDNGGRAEHATNYPFRGHKGMLFEGGIRVPFTLTWPAKIVGGRKYARPVSALDLFPTILDAADIEVPENVQLDGVSLVPFLQNDYDVSPHETLYWRYAAGDDHYGYAVRHGDDKLVYSVYKGKHLLFNLANDPWERNDLAEQNPEMVEHLITLYQAWDEGLAEPLWLDPHGPNIKKEEGKRQAAVDAAARGEK
ncbi:sulfatase family protein [Aporhodopirellula aestuarii]|uniref:Sulfatase-like hydrolase/transferase n=1 Tax=Aporhodopirellula aestuarii TaxID=2950107 RepID=A0ABT0U0Q6_9BACT|nr:sulfatase-like hydrolase/transferase [Aporhodopirellula aestuarii]MCM2370224.1 sulfatase-like hydrolase/transferase [Aporhodopirellula aestuarii]